NVLRAMACSLGLVWSGAFVLSAAAQTELAETESGLTVGARETAKSETASKKSSTGKKSTTKKAGTAKDAPRSTETTTAETSKAEAVRADVAEKSEPADIAATVTPAVDEVDPNQPVTETVINVAGWIIASNDNRGLPFAIVDKNLAQVLVFDAAGKLRGLAPVLTGSAVGDESAEGVADRELKDIPMEQRTTPAGRYLAGFGPATGGKQVLWVDYASAVSIHPMEDSRSSRKEKRKERLATATPEDNRITHGCINVSPGFYSKVVRPTFKKGGIFYVLPDTVPLQAAFPAYQQADAFTVTREPKKPPAKKKPAARPKSKSGRPS
ncbi:MAG TPA: hypothetical protein VFV70_14485, partial [Hyphomonadaceae bacterium]|nr:hypothetical protein [Hyphomonadaceae bacterium]